MPHFHLITSVSSVQFDGKIMELPILDSLVISTSRDDAITSKKHFWTTFTSMSDLGIRLHIPIKQ